jgi:putative component of toxin-antitoxin plasmid stabilization module
VKLAVRFTPEATSWLDELRDRIGRRRVLARLAAIEEEGHLGDWKALGDGLIRISATLSPARRGSDRYPSGWRQGPSAA